MASDNTKSTGTDENTASGKTKGGTGNKEVGIKAIGTNKMPKSEKLGVFVYIGPSLRGVISYGTIYTGKRSEVIARLSGVISAYPQIERLIVEDNEVAAARKKIKAGASLLAAAYADLLKN